VGGRTTTADDLGSGGRGVAPSAAATTRRHDVIMAPLLLIASLCIVVGAGLV